MRRARRPSARVLNGTPPTPLYTKGGRTTAGLSWAHLAFAFLPGLALSGMQRAEEAGPPPVRATVRLWLDTEHPLPALAAASAALAHEPRSAAAWAGLGGALFRNADFEAAEAAARHALALDPDDPDAHVALARCLETAGEHAGARWPRWSARSCWRPTRPSTAW
jgi:tetratricopeptide (TPR) repeat protein